MMLLPDSIHKTEGTNREVSQLEDGGTDKVDEEFKGLPTKSKNDF